MLCLQTSTTAAKGRYTPSKAGTLPALIALIALPPVKPDSLQIEVSNASASRAFIEMSQLPT
jgi:hypothetical protein